MALDTVPVSWIYIITALLGLIIGSFINVVIYRLPIMLQREWDEEPNSPPFNLATPASHCPVCHILLRWRDNIPLISWLLLRGRCRSCHQPIAWRYPCIELLTALIFLSIVLRFGASLYSLSLLGLCATLIVLAVIDIDTLILPDRVTLPLLWCGLLCALIGISPISLSASVAGAMLGYIVLWLIFWLFKLLTSREGLGYGDFKLLAALGAWLGVQSLLFIVLLASLLGTLLGSILLLLRAKEQHSPLFAFGPYLAFCAWIYLLFGNELILFYYQRLLGINVG